MRTRSIIKETAIIVFFLAFMISIVLRQLDITTLPFGILSALGVFGLAAYALVKQTAGMSENRRTIMIAVVFCISGILIMPVIATIKKLAVVEYVNIFAVIYFSVTMIYGAVLRIMNSKG